MTPIMCLQIIIAEVLFAMNFPKRDYFAARIIGGSIVSIYVTLWIELIYGFVTGTNFNYNASDTISGIVFKIIYYVIIFSMSIITIFFSFRQTFKTTLICCSLGYAMQFMASNLVQLLNIPFKDGSSLFLSIYNMVLGLISCLVIYSGFYFSVIRKNPNWHKSNQSGYKKIVLFLFTVLMCIGLSRLSIDDKEKSTLASIVEPVVFIMVSLLIILFQFTLSDNESITKELYTTKVLLHQEREQYSLTKENIEIINEKCHDLKHQISLLRTNNSEKKIQEIEKAVMIYDSTIKTGNDVLDILLSDKKLQCDSKKIKFTLVVNGKLLSFMNDMDLYSLFGNAISNAMESTAVLEDVSKRHISLKVREIGNLISIHLENYFQGIILFQDGLPKTKKDENYHGYGMKSIERIVSSYNGTMNITVKDDLFMLDILLPESVSS